MDDIYADTKIPDLNYGLTTFDNVAKAFITIFQTITMEGWTSIMNMHADAFQSIMAQLFFVACVLVCSFFILNLTVATMLDNYSEQEEMARTDTENYELLKTLGEEAKLPLNVINEIINNDTNSVDSAAK